VISLDEISRRRGVELVDVAGFNDTWAMPVTLWDAPHGFDTRSQPDHHSCHVIALRLKGSLVQRVEPSLKQGERLQLHGFSVHPAGRQLHFVAPASIRFVHLYVTDPLFRSVQGEICSYFRNGDELVQPRSVMYVDNELSDAIRTYVSRAFAHKDRPTKLEMESRSNLIVLRLLQQHWHHRLSPRFSSTEMPPWQVRKICNFLEQNLDRVVSLEELSDLLGLSKEHICRTFQNATGMPPLRWQLNRRIAVASSCLSETDMSLTMIAQQLGYSGQSAFGAQFKKVMGISPGRYRRNSQFMADHEQSSYSRISRNED
jgi:AraC family transcriptional regulator